MKNKIKEIYKHILILGASVKIIEGMTDGRLQEGFYKPRTSFRWTKRVTSRQAVSGFVFRLDFDECPFDGPIFIEIRR